MNDTINAGHIAPVGYTRTYTRYAQAPCATHEDAYRPFCPNCTYVQQTARVALEGKIIALILDREDGTVIDWVTPGYSNELAVTLAHQGTVVIREDVWDNLHSFPVARALISEAVLYADCFGVTLDELPETIR